MMGENKSVLDTEVAIHACCKSGGWPDLTQRWLHFVLYMLAKCGSGKFAYSYTCEIILTVLSLKEIMSPLPPSSLTNMKLSTPLSQL